ncbi:hypothetical protein [Halobacteriovorax sp. JY17]|uniref:hypothetical protein n=1 Tax=Halobacteriovorax sp. JY17 TaxID=2014617 RepID=UPI000C56CD49|nr:hypothetical protein [Halobacteriovorax sp. JY17]PIK14145.1 MAG: hypothetical protein CES88_14275 [Halobacteriovorax sp. JY17]
MLLELLKRFFFSFFLFLSCIFYISAGRAEDIKHSVGVYISQNGLKYFKNNLKEVIENNGFRIDEFSYSGTQINMEEQKLEDMIEDQEAKDSIVKVKNQITRFFDGIDLDTHRFQVDIEEVQFSANWEKISLDFYKPQLTEEEDPYDVLVYAWIEASDIKVSVDKLYARDLRNKFLGDVGVDGLKIEQVDSSDKLRIGLPVKLGKDENGKFKIVVSKPVSNMNDVKFDADFTSPLKLPEIKILINGHEVSLNLEEVEKLVIEKEPMILEKIQAYLQTFLEEEAPKMITEKAEAALDGGLFEVTQMNPPGAPVGVIVPKFFWKLGLEELNFVGDNLHIGLGASVSDPSRDHVPFPEKYTSLKYPDIENSDIDNYDITLALNQGLINRMVQLSSLRGYFEKMDLESGESIGIEGMPVVNFKGKGKNKPATLSLEIIYKVSGWQKAFVRNPIHINFDMNLDFPIDPRTGRIKMVATGIDLNTVYLDDKYIRLFASKVRKSVHEQIKDMQKDINGMEIADEIPVPSDLGGILLEKEKAEINKNGYLMIYNNYLE